MMHTPGSRHASLGRRTVAIALLVSMTGLAAPALGQTPTGAVEVQVLLFSGRPDPTFALSDAEIAQVSTLLAKAPAAAAAADRSVIPSRLGYRGLIIRNPAHHAGLPAEVAIFNGAMALGAEGKERRGDPDRQLEVLLLDAAMAKGAIPETVVRRAKEATPR